MKWAVGEQNNARIYSDNTEDFYCVDCYEKHQSEINYEETEHDTSN